jgi:hypothetical protein
VNILDLTPMLEKGRTNVLHDRHHKPSLDPQIGSHDDDGYPPIADELDARFWFGLLRGISVGIIMLTLAARLIL